MLTPSSEPSSQAPGPYPAPSGAPHGPFPHQGPQPHQQHEAMCLGDGKLVENIVQAIARDLLVHAMHQVTEARFRIVMHVHDEIIIDHPIGTGSVEEVCQLMAQTPTWAAGLPLDADGYECEFYRKD